MLKKIILALAVLLLVLQAVRPAKNLGEAEGPDSVVKRHAVPAEVRAVLQKACYDCHSDRTVYPWYAEIQPVGWWLASHVDDGKRHLNFSRFARYDAQRAAHKLDEIVDTVLARLQQIPAGPQKIFSSHPPLSERIRRLPAESATAAARSGPVPGTPAAMSDAAAEKPAAAEVDEDDKAFAEAAEKKPARKKGN